ncbi:MAG TPA: hypothetical protein VF698_11090 [Thermoanaerobaculia bacterium]
MRLFIVVAALAVSACATGRDAVSPIIPVGVHVDRAFAAVGEHRFVLKEVADAHQHIYAVSNASGEVQRLLWIQHEGYLPHVDDAYNYPHTRVVTHGGLEFDVSIGTWDAGPVAGSDRARAFELLTARNLKVSLPSRRVRLVHVPRHNPRTELMVIYAEPGADESADDALLARALQSFTVKPAYR